MRSNIGVSQERPASLVQDAVHGARRTGTRGPSGFPLLPQLPTSIFGINMDVSLYIFQVSQAAFDTYLGL